MEDHALPPLRRTPLAAVLTLVVLGAPSAGQEPAALDLAARLRAAAPTLLGTTRFVYRLRERSLGELAVTLERGPGAARYTARFSSELRLGGVLRVVSERALLDERLAALEVERREVTWREGVAEVVSSTRALEGDAWVAGTARAPASGPDYGPFACRLLLARALAGAPAGSRLTLSGVVLTAAGVSATPLEVVVAADEARGAAARVVTLAFGRERSAIALDPAGAPLEIVVPSSPLRLIPASQAPPAEPVPALPQARGAPSPREAVRRWLRVAAKLEPVDALDEVVDWAAAERRLEAEIGPFSGGPAWLAELLKAQLAGAPARLAAGEVEVALQGASIHAQDDEAIAVVPGLGHPIELVRTGEGWVITHFPH